MTENVRTRGKNQSLLIESIADDSQKKYGSNVIIRADSEQSNIDSMSTQGFPFLSSASKNLPSKCSTNSNSGTENDVITFSSNLNNRLSIKSNLASKYALRDPIVPLFMAREVCPSSCVCQGGKTLYNKRKTSCTEISWNDLTNMQYMTQGAMCRIFSAEFMGQKVAVKVPRLDADDPSVAAHDLEVELNVLWSLDHKYIIKLIGAGFRPTKPSRFIVLEFLEMGTLADRLNVGLLPNQPDSGYNKLIKGTQRYQRFHMMTMLERATELAEALEYLHSKVCGGDSFVVHRDLKPDNVGFKADGTLKLFDFGLARSVKRSTRVHARYDMTGETGSMRYMAPEVVESLPYNEKVDVYAFGLLIWEMLQYRRVFEGMSMGDFYSRVVNGGVRPPLDPSWPQALRSLVELCWHADVDIRPDFSYIAPQLQEIYNQEKQSLGKISHSAINVLEEKRHSAVISPIRRSVRSQTSTFIVGGPSSLIKGSKPRHSMSSTATSPRPVGSPMGGLISRFGKFWGRKKTLQALPTHQEHRSPSPSSSARLKR